MTISTDDQNRYRGGNHSTRGIINRVPKIIAATARINQTGFTYPIAQLAIDTVDTIHTVKAGYMFMIGTTPGAWDITAGVVNSMTNTALFFDAKSQGDPGFARSIIAPLADNLYITVLKFRPAWGLQSSIRKGVFYKNWNRVYKGETVNPEPVPVMGEWRQVFCPAGGSVTIALDGSDSWAWGIRTITAYAWNLDGGTVNTGTLASSTLTADFEPGFYELELSVRDSLNKAHRGYRYLWVNVDDPADDNAPFNYRTPCQIVNDTSDMKGREIGLMFGRNLGELDELFPGQAFLITESPEFNGEPLDGDDFIGSFVGYQTEGSKDTSYRVRQTTLTLKSPVPMAELIPANTQEMNETANPATWAECAKILSNPVGAVWYLAAFHAPYLIDGHDFKRDSEFTELAKLRRQTFQFKSTNIAGQLKTVQDMALCFIGSKSNGRLRMVRNPMYLDSDERNANPLKWTYTPGDIAGHLQRSFYTRMQVSQVYGYAFGYAGAERATPFQSLAPGYVRAQADGQTNATPFTVTLTGTTGQIKVNAVTGHMFAENNNVPNYNFTANRNLDFIDPIDADSWYALSVPSSYDSEGFGWVDERAMCVKVNRTWEYNSGFIKKTINYEFQPESFGVPGITVPVDTGGADNWWVSVWNPGIFDPYTPVVPTIPDLSIPVMLAVNSNGQLARCFNFNEPELSWQRIPIPAGVPVGFALDYNSPYFSDPNGAIAFTVVTLESNKIHVYRLADARRGVPVFTEFTHSPITATVTSPKAIKVKGSRTEANFVLVAWRESDGVYMSRSTASTPSLSTKAHVGSVLSGGDAVQLGEPLGMDVEDTKQIIVAPNGGTTLDGKNAYSLFVATSVGGSFTELTGNPLSTDESAVLGFAELNSTAFVSYIKATPPDPAPDLGVITFDTGGNPDYIIGGAGVTTGGNPDNCAWAAFNADGAGGQVGLNVQAVGLAGQYTVTDIEFDVKRETIGGSIVGDITEIINIECWAGGVKIGSGVPTFRENYGNGWSRYGLTSTELAIKEPPDSITVVWGYSFPDSNPSTIAYAYIDNVHITADALDFEGTRSLYGVNTGADMWVDKTPSGKQIPIEPYSLAHDPSTPNRLTMIGTNEGGRPYIMASNSSGDGWATTGRSAYKGVARSGDIVLAWGLNSLAISPDKGVTFYNRLGDWASKVGAIGEFLCVGGVL